MTDYSLDKGDVKQLFLSVMNGGKLDGILDPFFVKFKTECERISYIYRLLKSKIIKRCMQEKRI